MFFNSSVFPEWLININISWFVILPKSPWEQSFAEIENDGVPTDDKVADIFEAIFPLLPTPQIITFDLHLLIAFTASSKDLLIELFNFFNRRFLFMSHP